MKSLARGYDSTIGERGQPVQFRAIGVRRAGVCGVAAIAGKLGEHLGIDRIGLGEPPQRLRKVADLPRIHHDHRQAGGRQRGDQRAS